MAEDRDGSRVGEQNRHDDPDARRLPRAARADEPVGRATRHDEIQLVHRARGAESLCQALEAQSGFHRCPSRALIPWHPP